MKVKLKEPIGIERLVRRENEVDRKVCGQNIERGSHETIWTSLDFRNTFTY